MVRTIITLLIIALIAAVFGFGGIVEVAVDMAKIIFWITLVLLLISVVFKMVKKI